jgi:flavin reductase (DIM6/NTAB) family NADH-FMN oxidoreductase RutF
MTAFADHRLVCSFREVMAGVCSPVAVVTTTHEHRPRGATVSAFSSLSLHPPMVMLALDRGSELLACIAETKRFGVNVLASDQVDLARVFGRKGQGKFDHVAWCLDGCLPRLPDAPGWLVCEVSQLVDGGDHMVVFGAVLAGEAFVRPPLTYHRRSYGTHVALAT